MFSELTETDNCVLQFKTMW